MRFLIMLFLPLLLCFAFFMAYTSFLPKNSSSSYYFENLKIEASSAIEDDMLPALKGAVSTIGGKLSFFFKETKNLIVRIFISIKIYFHELLYERVVHFEGLANVTEDSLLKLLPKERSNISWYLSKEELKQSLLSIPTIKSIDINLCSFLSINCFNVRAEERQPFFVSSDKRWLLASDGTILKKTDANSLATYPLALGVDVMKESPDLLKAKISALYRVYTDSMNHLALDIRSLKFSKRGEVIVNFDNHPAAVRFEISDESNFNLSDQLTRLKYLLASLSESINLVSEIDLSMGRVGVVKYLQD